MLEKPTTSTSCDYFVPQYRRAAAFTFSFHFQTRTVPCNHLQNLAIVQNVLWESRVTTHRQSNTSHAGPRGYEFFGLHSARFLVPLGCWPALYTLHLKCPSTDEGQHQPINCMIDILTLNASLALSKFSHPFSDSVSRILGAGYNLDCLDWYNHPKHVLHASNNMS